LQSKFNLLDFDSLRFVGHYESTSQLEIWNISYDAKGLTSSVYYCWIKREYNETFM